LLLNREAGVVEIERSPRHAGELAVKFDDMILHGSGTAPQPRGIYTEAAANATAVTYVDTPTAAELNMKLWALYAVAADGTTRRPGASDPEAASLKKLGLRAVRQVLRVRILFAVSLATELSLLARRRLLPILRDARFRLVDVPSHALDVAALHRPVRQCRRGSLFMVGHGARSFGSRRSTLAFPIARMRADTRFAPVDSPPARRLGPAFVSPQGDRRLQPGLANFLLRVEEERHLLDMPSRVAATRRRRTPRNCR
jgi:hypothetical protein